MTPADFGLSVLSDLVANAIATVIASSGQEPKEAQLRFSELRSKLSKEQTIEAIVAKATAKVAKHLAAAEHQQALRRFLASPEAEAIVRQLFTVRIGRGNEETELTSTIRVEFADALAAYIGKETATEIAPALSEAVVTAIGFLLDKSLAAGSLTALDAKNLVRLNLLRHELNAIHRAIDSLRAPTTSISAVTRFEEQLRQVVKSRHCTIVPPHFDTAIKVPIDDIFVLPRLSTLPRRSKEKAAQEAGLYDILSGVTRLVILGNPGGGKSTLATKVCFDLAARYSERLAAGRELTPFIVILREYGAERKERPLSILEFIESVIRSKYQLHPDPKIIEYLLLSGRLLIIFDGLDELLDASYRREVSASVESFCTVYGNVPVIVTSREIGYEQAPLDPRVFDLCRLAPFDDKQIREYADKWFAIDSDLTESQQKEKSAAFLRESSSVSDLRTNPLMLALLCNIYRGENYIPQNRPDVYEKCAVMLFEKWDPSRGIHVELPFQAHIRPALMYVAHWIYGDSRLQAGVAESRIIEKTKEYLWPRRFEDPDEAVAAARSFVEFCRGRAWVFTDTGTTKDGEGLYQFTHRTFLEYFAAAYLVRTNETADALYGELGPKIAVREWDVIAQLAFQIKNKASEEAADRLLTLLLDDVTAVPAASAMNRLSFAARSLEFLVPSPRVTRQIVTAVVDAVTARALGVGELGLQPKEIATHDEFQSHQSVAMGTFSPLLRVASENHAVVLDELEKAIVALLATSDERKAIVAADLLFSLKWPFLHQRSGSTRTEEGELDEITDRVAHNSRERLRSLARLSVPLAMRLHWRQVVTMGEFVSWHGVEAVFRSPQALTFPETWLYEISSAIIVKFVKVVGEQEMSVDATAEMITDLEQIGAAVLQHGAPWAPKEVSPLAELRLPSARAVNTAVWAKISPRAIFGLFALISPIVERASDTVKNFAFDRVLPPVLAMALQARTKPKYRPVLRDELLTRGLSENEVAMIFDWARRAIDSTKGRPTANESKET